MKRIITYTVLAGLCLLAAPFACKKGSKKDTDKKTVVGTWKAYQYYNYVSTKCNDPQIADHKDQSQLSDILTISPDGTGNIAANGQILGTFTWTYQFEDISFQYLTISDYKIIVNTTDPMASTLRSYKYKIHLFGLDALGIGDDDSHPNSPCIYDDHSYDFSRLSY